MLNVLQLPGNLSKSNGRMTVLMNVYRQLDKEKIQFDFLATLTSEENYIDEILSLGGRVFFLEETEISIKNVRKSMEKILSENNYDIVHYHAISEWGISIDIPYRKKIKVISHSHATKLSDSFLKSFRNRIYTLNTFLFSTQFAACSTEAGDKLFLGHKFYNAPNVVNTKKYKFNLNNRLKYRAEWEVTDDILVLGNIGRLAKQKNQIFLLNVLQKILDEGVEAKLVIIGDGSQKEILNNKIKELGLTKNVVLVGEVSNPNDYYSAMDVFLLPSLFEGLPMVGIEAQANGLPAIFSDTTSKEVNMFDAKFMSIHQNNVEKWADQAISLWKKGRDQKSEDHIKAKNFDIITGTERWAELYSSTLKNKS
ncbi:glycosyltransferase [Leuconostoc lactis]|uniref:glycosyltransferase n=1 Tax=Leuconostoc lactis TaxID=1246 RepID=UPI00049840CA|nr:glycosyltransferase [Leuconostoc lactis]